MNLESCLRIFLTSTLDQLRKSLVSLHPGLWNIAKPQHVITNHGKFCRYITLATLIHNLMVITISGSQHHYLFFQILFLAITDELIYKFSKETELVSFDLEAFEEWKSHNKNPNIQLAADFVLTYYILCFCFVLVCDSVMMMLQ